MVQSLVFRRRQRAMVSTSNRKGLGDSTVFPGMLVPVSTKVLEDVVLLVQPGNAQLVRRPMPGILPARNSIRQCWHTAPRVPRSSARESPFPRRSVSPNLIRRFCGLQSPGTCVRWHHACLAGQGVVRSRATLQAASCWWHRPFLVKGRVDLRRHGAVDILLKFRVVEFVGVQLIVLDGRFK